MVGVLLPLLLASGAARAAPVGDPVADPAEGRVSLGAGLGGESHWVEERGCEESCDGVWRRNRTSLSGRLVLLPGVALDGELSRQSDRVQQANYRGQGLVWAGGARLAAPLGRSGVWLSAVGRYEKGETLSASVEEVERSRYQQGTVTGLVAWDSPLELGGVTAWGGAQAAWLWSHSIALDADGADALDIALHQAVPLSAVVGIGVTSDSLGPPWGPDWRMSLEVDGLIGQSNGVHGALRVMR